MGAVDAITRIAVGDTRESTECAACRDVGFCDCCCRQAGSQDRCDVACGGDDCGIRDRDSRAVHFDRSDIVGSNERAGQLTAIDLNRIDIRGCEGFASEVAVCDGDGIDRADGCAEFAGKVAIATENDVSDAANGEIGCEITIREVDESHFSCDGDGVCVCKVAIADHDACEVTRSNDGVALSQTSSVPCRDGADVCGLEGGIGKAAAFADKNIADVASGDKRSCA